MRLRIADHSIADCGVQIADLLNTTRNLHSTIKGVMFSIRNPQSATRKVMFSIRNPQSAIRNLALLIAALLLFACADCAGSSKPPV